MDLSLCYAVRLFLGGPFLVMDETFEPLGSSFPNQGDRSQSVRCMWVFIPPDLAANDRINHSNYLDAARLAPI